MIRSVVVKVGGSLHETCDLVARLQRWISTLDPAHAVLLTGGGARVKKLRRGMGHDDPAANVIQLSEDEAHWKCVRIMGEQTSRLCRNYPRGTLVESWEQTQTSWSRGEQPFFQVEAFLRADDAQPDRLPHTWDVSSDSIAARLAARYHAELVLIKACSVTTGPHDWSALAEHGVVDRWFPRVASAVHSIRLVNLPE